MVSFSYFSQLGQFSEICTIVKQRIVVESFFIISNMERAGKFNKAFIIMCLFSGSFWPASSRGSIGGKHLHEMQRSRIAGFHVTSSTKIRNLPIPLKF